MKRKQLHIMKHLRMNAREKLTKMSRQTGIPVSTIYENLKSFETRVIKKHTCLIDFRELGYDLRVTLLVKAKGENKETIRSFLKGHHQVNSVYRINNGYDFLAEVLFKNMRGLQQFLDALDDKGIKDRKEYYILDELSREAFLTNDTHLELIADAKS